MAVDAASFKAAFPEFGNAPNALVDATIARASLVCPASVWGAFVDQGIELTTAQWLALSPFGRSVQLVNKDGSTAYDQRLADLMTAVAGGPRVL